MTEKKYPYTEAQLNQLVTEAVDSVIIPLLTELTTLGVSQELIGTAMMNVAERKLDEDDDATEG